VTGTTPAVVLGASYRALAVVRSLGRRGVPVHVVQTDEHAIARSSRYATTTSTSSHDPEQLADHLMGLARRREGGAVLIPTHDEEAMAVARHHGCLGGHFLLTTPAEAHLRPAYDKRALAALASSLGVAQPWSATPRGLADLATLDPPFPIVIKPAWKPALNPLTVAKAWPVENAAELKDRYSEALTHLSAEALLLQELVPGGNDGQLAIGVLADGGRIVASVTARRTRQYPWDFGRASTYVETIEPRPELTAVAAALMRAMGFTGIAEIEFKHDPRRNEPLLLDCNPRAWGWISLCARAGVDLPWLLYRQTLGEAVPAMSGRAGERWLRLSTDLPTAITGVRRGDLALLPWVRTLVRRHENAVLVGDDLRPALHSPLISGRLLAGRVVHRGPV
jgi:predicted ATP-grasp superfamily ATP-dependent carboligase